MGAADRAGGWDALGSIAPLILVVIADQSYREMVACALDTIEQPRALHAAWREAAGQVIQLVAQGLRHLDVVGIAPDHIPAVASDIEILGLGREHGSIRGKMRLEEAPLGLGHEPRQLHLFRGQPPVQPGRNRLDLEVVIPSKQKLATICCIQVMPALGWVAMMMSSSRKENSFQTVQSNRWVCSSRDFRGHAGASVIGVSSCDRSRVQPGPSRVVRDRLSTAETGKRP